MFIDPQTVSSKSKFTAQTSDTNTSIIQEMIKILKILITWLSKVDIVTWVSVVDIVTWVSVVDIVTWVSVVDIVT